MVKKETFGNAIKSERVRKGLTIDAISRNVDLTSGYLSKLERDSGDGLPSIDTIEKLSIVLDIDFNYLYLLTGRIPVEYNDFIIDFLLKNNIDLKTFTEIFNVWSKQNE